MQPGVHLTLTETQEACFPDANYAAVLLEKYTIRNSNETTGKASFLEFIKHLLWLKNLWIFCLK
jgi:hypothetical protein